MAANNSSNDIIVWAMPADRDFLREYIRGVDQLRQHRLIPDLRRILSYKVYRIKGNAFGSHESIVLNHGSKYFTVELGFKITRDGVKRIYPITHAYLGPISKLHYCGEVRKSGNELLGRAVALMQKFGTYYKCLHNCQNFCNAYLKDIGLQSSTQMTDAERGFLFGVGMALMAGIGYLFIAVLTGKHAVHRWYLLW